MYSVRVSDGFDRKLKRNTKCINKMDDGWRWVEEWKTIW